MDPVQAVYIAIRGVEEFLLDKKEGSRETTTNQSRISTDTRWQTPAKGVIKVNVGGAWLKSTKKARAGLF